MIRQRRAVEPRLSPMPDPGTFALAQPRPSHTRRAFLSGASARAAAPIDGSDYWIRVHRRAMACRFEITLASGDAGWVTAARDALNEIDRFEDELSVFRETSAISGINRLAASGPVAIDEPLWTLLLSCERLHRETEGAFDITSTPLSRCWGFLQRQGRLPPIEEIEAVRALVGFDLVDLDEHSRTIRLRRPGVELNLGAIGKGFALDCVAQTMRRCGVADALLSAGQSSLLAVGGPDGGWLVEIVSPRVENASQPLTHVRLRDAALGTSGAGEQFVIVDGTRYGHVIDPRTGWPASGVVSVSVVASSAARADALSTAFLVGGVDLAKGYCSRHSNVMAIVTMEGTDVPLVFGNHSGASGARPARALSNADRAMHGTQVCQGTQVIE
jgi:FAD:protein FMN transferase